LEPEVIEGLRRLAMESRAGARPLRIALSGPGLPLKLRAAEAIAGELSRPLLTFDLRQYAANGAGDQLAVAVREALFTNAVFYAECDGVEERLGRALAKELTTAYADAVLAVTSPAPFLEDAAVAMVELARPSFGVRREQWRRSIEAERIRIEDAEVDSLAGRFRLHPDEIVTAVLSAQSRARWRGSRETSLRDLSAAARALSGRQIGTMARKIEPKYVWNDIVLPRETALQLRAICARVVHQHRVLDEWGFDRKLSLGKGVTALFAGPSGVGKKMAAEVIASELDIDLYRIDLAGVVSKYIGETEKNLDRIFTAAENANAILFFDEADALFGKRSEVKDSHDRYANIEISYLLQKMEMYDGVAILATNLRQNLDEAFLRRLAFTVHFPFPNEQDRRRIWESIWPSRVPKDPEADFDFLAATFRLSGGNIKNVALGAAFLAAADEGPVAMRHLLTAVDREYQKMGKPLAADAFGKYAAEVAS
jgi:AAA+ superfamily predicted ATPase